MCSCHRNRDKLFATDRQAPAALRAAPFEHQSPIFCAHSHQKPVSLRAMAVVGLKRTPTLHRLIPPRRRTGNVSERLPRVSIEVFCATVAGGVPSSSGNSSIAFVNSVSSTQVPPRSPGPSSRASLDRERLHGVRAEVAPLGPGPFIIRLQLEWPRPSESPPRESGRSRRHSTGA